MTDQAKLRRIAASPYKDLKIAASNTISALDKILERRDSLKAKKVRSRTRLST